MPADQGSTFDNAAYIAERSAAAGAWSRSGGRCERCSRQVVWHNRGRALGRGAWSLLALPGAGAVRHVVMCAGCAAREQSRGG